MSSSNRDNKHAARFNQRKRAYLKRTNRYRRPCIEQLETRRLLVNEIPTLDFINDSTIAEDVPQQTVNLTGITAGGGESQTLRVSATSSNTALIPNPGVTYTSANTTGSIAFTPIADKSGTSVITVTVEDAGLDNDLLLRQITSPTVAPSPLPSTLSMIYRQSMESQT